LSRLIHVVPVQKVSKNAKIEIKVANVFFLFSIFFVSKALNKNIIKNIVSTNTKILNIIVVDISRKLLI
jgi:cytosine/uracil/thiamine/allantoin permease